MKNHLKKILEEINIDSSKSEYSVGELELILREVSRKFSFSRERESLRSNSRKQMVDAVTTSIAGPIYWVDRDLIYLGVNKHVYCSEGACPSQMIGQKVGFSSFDQFLKPVLESFFQSQTGSYSWDVKLLEDGSPKWYSMTATKYNNDRAAVVFGYDVTERRFLEEKLQKSLLINTRNQKKHGQSETKLSYSQKMVALGEMADAVAHEINNPLAIINGRTSIALNEMTQESHNLELVAKSLSSISGATKRIAKIVKGLRLFSKNVDDESKGSYAFRELIQDVVETHQEKLDQLEIKIAVADRTDGIWIDCKRSAFYQSISSMIENSIYAVKDLEDQWIQLNIDQIDGMIELSIIDSGNGIEKDLAWKIFKPFFSTNEFGKGTGLGLSIARGIIDDLGGSIGLDFSSKNTKFILLIPCTKQKNKNLQKVG
jgi:signal transduction histidine kinase